jgi:hypothetical protein
MTYVRGGLALLTRVFLPSVDYASGVGTTLPSGTGKILDATDAIIQFEFYVQIRKTKWGNS